jgi:hypothetical protein
MGNKRQPGSRTDNARQNKARVRGMKTEDLKLLVSTLEAEIAKATSLLHFAKKEISMRNYKLSARFQKKQESRGEEP